MPRPARALGAAGPGPDRVVRRVSVGRRRREHGSRCSPIALRPSTAPSSWPSSGSSTGSGSSARRVSKPTIVATNTTSITPGIATPGVVHRVAEDDEHREPDQRRAERRDAPAGPSRRWRPRHEQVDREQDPDRQHAAPDGAGPRVEVAAELAADHVGDLVTAAFACVRDEATEVGAVLRRSGEVDRGRQREGSRWPRPPAGPRCGGARARRRAGTR